MRGGRRAVHGALFVYIRRRAQQTESVANFLRKKLKLCILECRVTRMDKIRKEYIRVSLKVAPVAEKIKGNRFSWCEHVMRRDETHVTRRVMCINVEG